MLVKRNQKQTKQKNAGGDKNFKQKKKIFIVIYWECKYCGLWEFN